jgi:hypothetical protein
LFIDKYKNYDPFINLKIIAKRGQYGEERPNNMARSTHNKTKQFF